MLLKFCARVNRLKQIQYNTQGIKKFGALNFVNLLVCQPNFIGFVIVFLGYYIYFDVPLSSVMSTDIANVI